MKRLLLVLLLTVAPPAQAKKLKLYDGPERPEKELAVYSLWNYPGFFGSLQIYTVALDGTDFEAKGGMGAVPATGGYVLLAPGKHRARISFVDSKHILFPAYTDARTFPGWYDIEFEVEAGKTYAPIFDMTLPKAGLTDRMCVGASSKRGSGGLGEIRKSKTYLACAPPTLDPKTDRKTWCRSWDGHEARTLLCKHEVPVVDAPGEPPVEVQPPVAGEPGRE